MVYFTPLYPGINDYTGCKYSKNLNPMSLAPGYKNIEVSAALLIGSAVNGPDSWLM